MGHGHDKTPGEVTESAEQPTEAASNPPHNPHSRVLEHIASPVRKSRIRQLLTAILVAGVGVLGFAASSLAVLSSQLPPIDSLADYRPPVASKLYDRNGALLHRYYRERRTVVPFERIPHFVRQAFMAAEDEDFYKHGGLDYLAIVRAAVDELMYRTIGGRRSGGSTITQQTAKTFFLSPEKTYTRKLREWLLAKRIEERFSKDEILYLYLNQIYFGHGAYGIDEAARTYYGVGVDDLSLGQAAALAGVPKAPSRINPFSNPQRCAERRRYVLRQMWAQGWIDETQEQAALDEPIRIPRPSNALFADAAYPAEVLRRRIEDRYGSARLLESGLRIYSSLNGTMQSAAQEALRWGLRQVDKRQGWRGPILRIEVDERKEVVKALRESFASHTPRAPDGATQDPSLSFLGQPAWDLSSLNRAVLSTQPRRAARRVELRTLAKDLILAGLVVEVDDGAKLARVDLGSVVGELSLDAMKWARPYSPMAWTPTPRRPSQVLRSGDVVWVRVLREDVVRKKTSRTNAEGDSTHKDAEAPVLSRTLVLSLEQMPKVQGAIVVIEPHRHEVLAMAGGFDFARSSFDRATQARRQPGSGFKPIVYAAGIASGRYTPASLITDAPKVFRDRSTGRAWKPSNYDGSFRGDITVRTCLTHSVNMCSIQILDTVGVDTVIELAHKMGITSSLPKSLTLALGAGEVTPLELANAYAVFPGEGRAQPPVLIQSIKDASGEVLQEARYEQKQVLSPEVAYVMVQLMRSVVEHGTAQRAKLLERPVAGKTGTSNEQRNAWFTGYTPDLVASVYVGFDDNAPLGRSEYGSRAALPIWLRFMQKAVANMPVRDFKAPPGVIFARINALSGLLASADDPDAVDEVFIEGSEPTEQHQQAAAPPSLFRMDEDP